MRQKFIGFGLIGSILVVFWISLGPEQGAQRVAGATAQMQATGKIQGHVTASDGGDVTGIPVVALDGPPWFFPIRTTTIESDGTYSLDGLAPGTYYIEFNAQEGSQLGVKPIYLSQFYNNTRVVNEADGVAVTANQTMQGINARLQLGGTITGVVTAQATGQPLAGIPVSISSRNIPDGVGKMTQTDALGRYFVNGLPSGAYVIQWNFDSLTANTLYLSEWYDRQATEDKANFVTVSAGSVIANINAALTLGGMIRGQITSAATGEPITDATVRLCMGEGDQCDQVSTRSDPTGAYTVTRLATGDYRLAFEAGLQRSYSNPNFSYPYFSEYHQDKRSLTTADLVHVEASTVVEINAALEPSLNITGRIADTNTGKGLIFRGTNIEVYTENGDYVRTAYLPDFSDTYAVTELPPGRYRLRATDLSYTPLYYPTATTFEEATTLVVQARQVLTDLNFALTTLRHDTVRVVTAPQLGNALLAVSDPITLPQYSLDDGQNWQHFATTPWETGDAPLQIALAPRNIVTAPVRFIVAASSSFQDAPPTRGGLFRTGDNGRSWTTYTPPIEPPCTESFITFSHLTTSPADPVRLYVIAACYHYEQPPVPLTAELAHASSQPMLNPSGYEPHYSLYTSTDAGVTWQRTTLPEANSASFAVAQLLPSPVTADWLYLSVREAFGNPDSYRWQQSNDGGQTWTMQPFTPTLLAPDPKNVDRLFGIFDAGARNVFRYTGKRSMDSGATWITWRQQPCPTSARQLLVLPVASLLLLRCDQGIFRSRNQGDAWEQISNVPGQLLTVDLDQSERIFWSLQGKLYASSDQGTTWRQIGQRENLWIPVIRASR